MGDLLCSGPGPHEPPDGVLGTADSEDVTALCALCGPRHAPDEPPPED